MSDPQTPTATRKSSGYRRLQGRHRDLIAIYERLRQDHEELETAFSELLALHDGLLADLRAKKSHPLTAALAGHAQIGGGHV